MSRSCLSAASVTMFGLQNGQQFLGSDLFAGVVRGLFQNRVLNDLLGDHLF